jgi:hypothetical protein
MLVHLILLWATMPIILSSTNRVTAGQKEGLRGTAQVDAVQNTAPPPGIAQRCEKRKIVDAVYHSGRISEA